MTLRLRDVAADLRAGRKARTLSRLLAEGLPVLDGIVLVPGASLETLAAELRVLGPGPYVVRSSSELEDTEGASAAGLYLSSVGVGLAQVAAAIAEVRASADATEVLAYLAARSLVPAPIAVLVQPDVGQATLGVARSTSSGFLVEERASDTPEWGDTSAAKLDRAADDPLVILLERVERLLGGAVDVEYARRGADLLLLQARPVARVPALLRSGRFPPGRWRLDAEHNPDPISAAQAGLVALVDGPRFGPRARVIGGYLYVREDLAPPVRAGSPLAALERFHELIEPALRAELAAAEGSLLPTALGTYVRVVRRYASEVRPTVGLARRELEALLRREIDEALADHPRLLGGAGGATTERDAALYALGREPSLDRGTEYLARFGAYAPAWDVAVPCDDEDPTRLLQAATARALGPSPDSLAAAARALADDAAEAVRRRLSASASVAFDRGLMLLRTLLTLAESDDVLFFEGQRLVRRALLARGRALVEEGRLRARDEVFDLPLSALGAGGSFDQRAALGKKARALAARTVPPFRIVDRIPQQRLPASSEVLRGRGIGGTGRGKAVVYTSLLAPLPEIPEGAVLVLPTALPSLAPYLSRLAGLVTEHGGALSHAATLAREIGLPTVVGVAGATQIPDGTELYVDGERGRVLLLRRES